MNVFGVGPTEIFIVLIVILVLFGPERLPELAKKIGGASREIRDNLNNVNEQMNSALEASMEIDKAKMIQPASSTAAPTVIDQPTNPTPAESPTPENSSADATSARSDAGAENRILNPDSIVEPAPPAPPPQG
ncbi:MAG: twin-arginine translocase TatA/TatE family subunit [Anaerolineae bacterium]|nr:twin-arginine translocase TatA/TatE family subunit [Anaerolineae bacterium]